MDRLPTVISCCFCCFLRAGSVMIGLFSFMAGLFFAPNVSHTKFVWFVGPALGKYIAATEEVVRVTLGVFSIMLCVVSLLLVIGACCNMPILLEIYQWGVLVYSVTVSLLFLVLAGCCFLDPPPSPLAGGILLILVVCNLLTTTYFILVVNSLRISLKYSSDRDIIKV